MKQFTKTKLAAAVGTATMALALASPANAAVVVGGDNGWEISFSGFVNAFYTHSNCDTGCGPAAGGGEDSSRVTSGFLPSFFTFAAKSPTVNGLTGTAKITFAPTVQTGKAHTALYDSGLVSNPGIQGASINTRENVFDVSGSFGTISVGQTLSHFGRQAILKDMTLFGVGGLHGSTSQVDWGTVTTGRVGLGYVYPDFNARFAWTSPNMNGFGISVGIYDPSEPPITGGSAAFETDVPRFEGELTYTTTFTNGSATLWVDGTWQEVDAAAVPATAASFAFDPATGGVLPVAATAALPSADYDREGWGVGGQVGMSGFELTGYYYDGDNLGTTLAFASTPVRTAAGFQDMDNDGFYLQGTYTFNGRTKVGVSYGESNLDGDANYAEIEQDMWTVGVYHDITSWLKVMAEYSEAQTETETAVGSGISTDTLEYDLFSVGSFILW